MKAVSERGFMLPTNFVCTHCGRRYSSHPGACQGCNQVTVIYDGKGDDERERKRRAQEQEEARQKEKLLLEEKARKEQAEQAQREESRKREAEAKAKSVKHETSHRKTGKFGWLLGGLAFFITAAITYSESRQNGVAALILGTIVGLIVGKFYKLILAIAIAGFIIYAILEDKKKAPTKPSAATETEDVKPIGQAEAAAPTITPTPQEIKSLTPAGTIEKVWSDHNIFHNNKKGMMIHVSFTVENLQYVPCGAGVYFYNEAGVNLIDLDNQYRTTDGKVSTNADFTPGNTSARYDDFKIFMPYDQLELASGESKVKYDIRLYKKPGEFIAQSELREFPFSKPAPQPTVAPTAAGKIEKVWAEHNIFQNDKKGIMIHVSFTTINLQSIHCRASAYFHDESGGKLSDSDSRYRAVDGQVSTGDDFTPAYVSARYDDFKIFMPYDQLDLSVGEYKLKFLVELYVKGGQTIASSEYVDFTYRKRLY